MHLTFLLLCAADSLEQGMGIGQDLRNEQELGEGGRYQRAIKKKKKALGLD